MSIPEQREILLSKALGAALHGVLGLQVKNDNAEIVATEKSNSESLS